MAPGRRFFSGTRGRGNRNFFVGLRTYREITERIILRPNNIPEVVAKIFSAGKVSVLPTRVLNSPVRSILLWLQCLNSAVPTLLFTRKTWSGLRGIKGQLRQRGLLRKRSRLRRTSKLRPRKPCGLYRMSRLRRTSKLRSRKSCGLYRIFE